VMYAGRFVETALTDELFRTPQHPYTEALLRAVPRLDAREHARLAAIRGMPPRLDVPFAECPFAPRCPLCEPRCRAGVPALRAAGTDRAHACLVRQEAP